MVKCVIIGATGTAYKRVLPALRDCADIEVSAVSARDEEKLAALIKEFGIKRYYTDYRAMLEKENYDFVYIATPPHLHYEALCEAVRFTRNVLVEKPLTVSALELSQIEKIIKNQNVAVFYQTFSQEATGFIENFLKADYGKIIDCTMTWQYLMNRQNKNVLWKDSPVGVHVMFDVGVHLLNAAYHFFGAPKDCRLYHNCVESIYQYDYAHALLDYGGFPVVINAAQTHAQSGDFVIQRQGATLKVEGYFGEKSAKKAVVTTADEMRQVEFREENLYQNVFESFARKKSQDCVCAQKDTMMLKAFQKILWQ